MANSPAAWPRAGWWEENGSRSRTAPTRRSAAAFSTRASAATGPATTTDRSSLTTATTTSAAPVPVPTTPASSSSSRADRSGQASAVSAPGQKVSARARSCAARAPSATVNTPAAVSAASSPKLTPTAAEGTPYASLSARCTAIDAPNRASWEVPVLALARARPLGGSGPSSQGPSRGSPRSAVTVSTCSKTSRAALRRPGVVRAEATRALTEKSP